MFKGTVETYDRWHMIDTGPPLKLPFSMLCSGELKITISYKKKQRFVWERGALPWLTVKHFLDVVMEIMAVFHGLFFVHVKYEGEPSRNGLIRYIDTSPPPITLSKVYTLCFLRSLIGLFAITFRHLK